MAVEERDTRSDGEGCSCGCTGCLGFILFGFTVWALLFGVTVGGRHYGVSCSTERGVEIR